MDISTSNNLKAYLPTWLLIFHGLLQGKDNITFIILFPGPTARTVLHTVRMTSLEWMKWLINEVLLCPRMTKILELQNQQWAWKLPAYCGLQAADQLIHSVNDWDTLSDRMLAGCRFLPVFWVALLAGFLLPLALCSVLVCLHGPSRRSMGPLYCNTAEIQWRSCHS